MATQLAGAFFERHGLIWRTGDGSTDFGIDGELEFADDSVAGLILKCQIKGVRRMGNKLTVPVKASTINYWSALPLPVMAILVDVAKEKIYWSVPSDPLPDTDKGSLVFTREACASSAPDAFLRAARNLAQWPAASSTLDQVEGFLHIWSQIAPDVGRLDPGYPVTPQDDAGIFLLYEHVSRLRCFLGLLEPTMLPMAYWRARSGRISVDVFDEYSTDLLDLVAGEIVAYLAPLYRDALKALSVHAHKAALIELHPRVAELLDSGMLEPSSIDDFFESPATSPIVHGGKYVYYGEADPFHPEVHIALDLHLKAIGVRRVRLSEFWLERVRKARKDHG
nr:DUF4365 domain-containing protein [Planosporangium thailandense]